MDDVLKDQRFKHIARDPRFRRMKRKDRKVKIDKRFQGMFKDEQFKLQYTVDKRGRPIHSSTNENLQKYYDMESSDEEEEEDSDTQEETPTKNDEKKEKVASAKKNLKSEAHDSSESGEDADEQKETATLDQADKDKSRVENSDEETSEEDSDSDEDLARGQGNVETSSSEDEEDAEEQEELDHKWGELAKDAELVNDATHRLALCNMDWDRIKASDIFVLMNSFKPAQGTIKSVTIYPSEYGQQRLKEEETKGPIELVESQGESNEDDPQHRERLRQYQLNRLRYYYAVITCDSAVTANHIYEECDGMEYESSANKIDLRFIPEDMTFDQEPKSHATHMPDASTYKPTLFSNSALNQSKVDLTWDETDKDRIAMTMRKFKQEELDEMDVKDYLASSSGSDGEGDDPYAGFEDPDFGSPETAAEPAVNKLKELVKSADDEKAKEKAAAGDLEITWEAGLNTGATQKKKKKDGDLTQWELYLEKKKEKKKQKRDEKSKSKSAQKSAADPDDDDEDGDAFSDDDLPSGVDLHDSYFQEELSKPQSAGPESKSGKKKKKKTKAVKEPGDVDKEAQLQMLMMDEDDGRQHFSLAAIQQKEQGGKKKKRKAKRKQESASAETQDTFQLNVGDDRFRDIYSNPLFNIDPSAPEYKKTQAMDALVKEKFKRRDKGSKEDKSKSKDSEKPSKKPKLESGTLQDASLASLVKSVKAKTKTLQERKKKKLK